MTLDSPAGIADRRAREAAEERLHLAVEATETGIWTWEVATGAVTWSAECYVVHGLQPGGFDGTAEGFFRLVHPDDAERVSATLRAAMDRHELYACEFRIIRPDGTIAWVTNRGRARYDEAGEAVSVLGTIADVTARRDAEQALQVALEASRTGTFRWDIRGNALSWDSALDKLFGVEPGQGVQSLDDFIARVHPDDRAEVIARCERCRDLAVDFDMEYRVVHPDGSVHWLYDRGKTVVDSAGAALYMTGACVDVTDRKRVQDALQTRERELQSIADNSPDVIARFDRSLRHVFVSAAVTRFSGRKPEEFLGRTNRELGMPETLCEQVDEAVLKVFATGKPHGMQFQLEHDGKLLHFSSRLVPEHDAGGEVATVLGVTRDVTQAWETQEALRRADRQKDDFLATLAHELRNPLAPIRTGLAVLRKRDSGSPEERRVRDIMDRQLRHMVRLVDDLLDIARISQGKIVLEREVLSLQTVIEHAVDYCRPVLEAKAHRVEVAPVPADWLVQGDETRLVQVFGNLLNNAGKYTPNGGRILVAAERDGADWRVTIDDNGLGIPAAMLPRIFDRFVQADQHLDRSEGGLGIGLSVVRSLVEMHGGRVAAESDGPGTGSRFSVWLPKSQVEGPAVIAVRPTDAGAPAASPNLRLDGHRDAGSGEALR